MADQEHLAILKQGVQVWNQWRKEHPNIEPDLSKAALYGADLSHADLSYADLYGADLSHADLYEAGLSHADLSEADLRRANLCEAHLRGANLNKAELTGAALNNAYLTKADLTGASLQEADLRCAYLSMAILKEANLSGANLMRAMLYGALLEGANLKGAILVETNLSGAILTNCSIYGIAAWNVRLEEARQESLIITQSNESTITVDNLKIAQFFYLLLNNAEIRDVIDTITSKVVLILGRFTPERKRVLDALRDELRKKDYLPIVFDFQKPTNRDLTETVSTLAHMARFIIADITAPKSIPQELKTIVPNLPSVPVQPLLHARSKEYGMFEHFKSFPWVLEAYHYTTVDRLLASLKEKIIEPAERKAQELGKK